MLVSLQPGDLVERYRVEAVLGEGGTARVYRVRHTTLSTVHALKVLTIDHEGVRRRLIAEGKAQALMNHPNVVAVRDVLEVQGSPALLMDFVPGRSLEIYLRKENLPIEQLMFLFRGIVTGVVYAHEQGLIHRDLKPANVLLDESGEQPVPRVADFGLVRAVNLPENVTRTTRVGMTMGTPGFMAPEQLRDARSVDKRGDIYALGAVLYVMLTGRLPFAGDDLLQLMNDAANGRYPALQDVLGLSVPPSVNQVVDRCLAPNPAERFQSAAEILDCLGELGGPVAHGHTLDWAVRPVPEVAPVAPLPATHAQAIEEDVPGTATVTGLVVDQSGLGHAVQVRVRLDPDGSGVRHAPEVSRDAQVAAQLAVAVALGDEAQDWGVTWTLAGLNSALHGSSLGMPLAMAIHCARHGLVVPANWAFTGGVDLDGRIAPVTGVPAKLRAAQAAGVSYVAIPADGLGELKALAGLEVVPSRTMEGLKSRLFPVQQRVRRWWWRPRFLALVVPVLMAFTTMTQRFEPLINDPLLRWVHGRIEATNTVIVAFPPQADARQLRETHPAVIDQLVQMGARTIFFDITMTASSPQDDAMAAAMQRAKKAGVAVIMPVVLEGGQVLLPESPRLREAAEFGAVLAHVDTALWHVRRAPVRVRTLSEGTYWHAAVQSVRGHLAVREEARVADGFLIMGPNRNPVWADVVQLHPAQASPVLAYDTPDAWSGVRGKTVIIGEMGGSDDLHRTDSDTVYGVEIEAALIETLLQQRAPRVASPEVDALFAFLVGALTGLVGLALPRNRAWIAFIVPAAALGVVLVLVVAGVLVATIPLALASAIGLWVSRRRVVTNPSRHS